MKIHEQKTQIFNPKVATEPFLPRSAFNAETVEDELFIPAPREQRRALLRPFIESLIVSFFFVVGLLLVLGVAFFYNSSLIFPGVTAMGVELGQYSRAEASTVLQTAWNRQTVTLVNGLETWTVHPSEMGIMLDADATAARAFEQGRTGASWLHFLQNQGQFPVSPVWRVDATAAEAFLSQQAAVHNIAPQNATIKIVNGRVETVPAVDGSALDIAATKNWLLNHVADVALDGRLPLISAPVPAEVTDASGFVAQAERLLTASVNVEAYDPVKDTAVTWFVSPTIWSEWLLLDVDAHSNFSWTLDQADAALFFDDRIAALGEGRSVNVNEAVTAVADAIKTGGGTVQLRVYHSDSVYTVQPGDTLASIGRQVGIPYPYIQAANPAVDALSVGQTLVIPSPDVMLPLPVVEGKRIVVSISEQRVYVYEQGALKWEWLASTGIASSPTAPGVFQIQSHEPNAYAANWNLYMPNFMGVYRPVPGVDFMNGFHGFPTRDGYNLLWTQNLGGPVTYGCILLSNENIALLYDWAEDGVVVEIRE